jgi:hypothetical protein
VGWAGVGWGLGGVGWGGVDRATALAESMAKSSSLTNLQLTHNVVRDPGAKKIEAALQENWTLLKLTLEGNNFDPELGHRISDYVARNNKMHTLSLLQAQNQCEFDRVKDRVQPPPWETGHRPVRFAHEIEISRTNPRMFAALEMVSSSSLPSPPPSLASWLHEAAPCFSLGSMPSCA